jgi:hypothetical protein
MKIFLILALISILTHLSSTLTFDIIVYRNQKINQQTTSTSTTTTTATTSSTKKQASDSNNGKKTGKN